MIAIITLSPLFLLIGLAIKIDSKGPVFFRQKRIGINGKIFYIHKFRTMEFNKKLHSKLITIGLDPRITRIGFFLRKYKIDELAQLIDVFLCKMSIVGPRPEVEKYVSYYPGKVKKIIFSVRPGITDFASIFFRNESEILAGKNNPENFYIKKILPKKIELYVKYVETRNFFVDLKIIFETLKILFFHKLIK